MLHKVIKACLNFSGIKKQVKNETAALLQVQNSFVFLCWKHHKWKTIIIGSKLKTFLYSNVVNEVF